MEDHFSGPEDPHTTTTPTSDEDGPDLSVIAQAVRYTLQPESHLPQQANSTTGSAGTMFEGLPAISQASTTPLMTTVAAPYVSVATFLVVVCQTSPSWRPLGGQQSKCTTYSWEGCT